MTVGVFSYPAVRVYHLNLASMLAPAFLFIGYCHFLRLCRI